MSTLAASTLLLNDATSGIAAMAALAAATLALITAINCACTEALATRVLTEELSADTVKLAAAILALTELISTD